MSELEKALNSLKPSHDTPSLLKSQGSYVDMSALGMNLANDDDITVLYKDITSYTLRYYLELFILFR